MLILVDRKPRLTLNLCSNARPDPNGPSIETVKANGLEPSAYIRHVLERIAEADKPDKLERLLPWNVDLAPASGNTTPSG